MIDFARTPFVREAAIAFVFVTATIVFGFSDLQQPGPGLDPSWGLGLTEAMQHGLLFGRDIVFTYGPLGFLLMGRGTPETIREIGFAHLFLITSFAAVSLVYVAGDFWWRRLIVLACLSLSVTFAIHPTTIAAGGIVVLSTLLLARSDGTTSLPYIGFGIFAGLIALTKFTFALEAVAAATILVTLRRSSVVDRRLEDATAFAVALLSTIGAYFLGSRDGVGAGLFSWIAIVGLTVMLAIFRRGGIVRRVLLFIAALNFATVLVLKSGGGRFLWTSLQVAIGYSSAMSLPAPAGNGSELILGVLFLVLVALFAFTIRESIGIRGVIAIAVIAFLDFKEGFVREDLGHVVEFILPIALIIAALIRCTKNARSFAVGTLAFSVTVYFVAIQQSAVFALSGIAKTTVADTYTVAGLTQKVAGIASTFRAGSDASWLAQRLAPDKLDDSVLQKLRSRPVDVQGYETALAFENDLAWSPEPIFQSYSAYTTGLDAINAASLTQGDRYVLLNVDPIDQRLFMAESPAARRVLICDYTIETNVSGGIVSSASGDDYAVLHKSGADRCRDAAPVRRFTVRWGQSLEIGPASPGVVTFASASYRLSAKGRVVRLAYKIPAIFLHESITSRDYRILPEVSSTPFVVDPIIETTEQFAALYRCAPSGSPERVSFHTADQSLFASEISVTLQRVRIKRC